MEIYLFLGLYEGRPKPVTGEAFSPKKKIIQHFK
jgi:hypothetical protein